jgi:alpha-mannosidase
MVLCAGLLHAQTVPPKIDTSKQPTLYLVGYAHLDTQWRWTYPQVIREFIANTLHNNFALMDKYPDYVFNFTGSRRYEFMKEYYPADFEKLKTYVKRGQWFPAGSSVDEGDANVPSAESLVRHTLYGNHFFNREFGVSSQEFMLPDCFGFPYALPTILVHCGVKQFSTQKLTWGSAVGIPFKVGNWVGPDGKSVVAALDPGSYSAGFSEDLSQNTSWLARINNTGNISGAYVDYHYYGTGDRGGSPDENSVKWMETSLSGTGPIKVVSSRADQLVKDLSPAQVAKLPRYKGELLLVNHSAGSINSEAYMKRWNRKGELLGDDAERASVMATWLGGSPYPTDRIYKAWLLVLGSQMHDMLPGTSLPLAYDYCWNDEILAQNQFAAITKDGAGVAASALDTMAKGTPLVVYNPLSVARQDVVEATIPASAEGVQVYGPDGQAVPTQIDSRDGSNVKILFLASVGPVGYAVYDARPTSSHVAGGSLKVTDNTLENQRFRVTINHDGEISSIYDKVNKTEALSAPTSLDFQFHNPGQFPAWNMDWADAQKPAYGHVTGPAQMRIVENGPVRVAIEVTRSAFGSKFIQTYRLSAGSAGDRVEVATKIDWQTRETALQAAFPFKAGNPLATYDLQVGAIQRGNNGPKKFEVPQHQWFDLTGTNGKYGVGVLNDCKFGSDKPTDNIIRLTLLYTPGVRGGYQDQASQDIGRHDILYALAPHVGDWRKGNVPWQAKRLNQPLLAFATTAHPGALGKSFSLVSVNTNQVQIEALKKAEDSNEIVVRLRELNGANAGDVQLRFAAPIVSAREVDGQERPIGSAKFAGKTLTTNVSAYSLRAFAIKLASAPVTVAPAVSKSVPLAYDACVSTNRNNLTAGAFDAAGRSLAAEMIPQSTTVDGITFNFGPTADGAKNAVTCQGQSITLPAGYHKVYLLAAATEDTPADFQVGGVANHATVQSWSGFIGQWDHRLWAGEVPELTYDWHNALAGLVPGYVKTSEVAWFSSHDHIPGSGDGFYEYSYLYKYGFNVPTGATTLTLPNSPHIKVLAVSVGNASHDGITAAQPLYDTLADHGQPAESMPSEVPSAGAYKDATLVSIQQPLYYVDGGLRYTTDGSTPTASSPVYAGPFWVTSHTTVKTAEVDGTGHSGPVSVADYDVNDTTAPKITAAEALMGVGQAIVHFSVPVTAASAQNPANFTFSNGIHVTAAVLDKDGQSVNLTLDNPVAVGTDPTVTVNGVTDTSPNANVVRGATFNVSAGGRVFTTPQASYTKSADFKQADLPVKANDPWTINLFFKTDTMPDNKTLIAGFGTDTDGTTGTARYISKFANGLHFWSANDDVETSVPIDLGKWQMLTVTFDGKTVRMYKNADKIAEQGDSFVDDTPEVHILPVDAWEHDLTVSGEVKDFTIWKSALSPDAIRELMSLEK